jgi:segregation and condensation protein B
MEEVKEQAEEVVESSQSAAPQEEAQEAQDAESLSELERARAAFDLEDLPAAIEALLLANGEPLAPSKIQEVFAIEEQPVLDALNALSERYKAASSGFELKCVGGQYQLRTKNHLAVFIRALNQSKPKRLTGAALETLAIIAYRQPIVKSDIETIRGVDATPTIKTLIDRKLVKIVGHQSTVGQPALYGTTEDFLKVFGLGSLSELPSLRDMKELDSDPGEDGAALYANNLQEEAVSSEA